MVNDIDASDMPTSALLFRNCIENQTYYVFLIWKVACDYIIPCALMLKKVLVILDRSDKICGGDVLTALSVHQVLRDDNQQTLAKD